MDDQKVPGDRTGEDRRAPEDGVKPEGIEGRYEEKRISERERRVSERERRASKEEEIEPEEREPLCKNCILSEGYTKKVTVLWYGAFLVSVLLLPLAGWFANDVYDKLLRMETKMSTTKESGLVTHDVLRKEFSMDLERMERQNNELERHVLIMLLNQKRMMSDLKIPYIEPYQDRTIENILEKLSEIKN